MWSTHWRKQLFHFFLFLVSTAAMYVPDNWWPPIIGSNPYDVLPTANSSLDASNTTSTTPYDGLFHWTSHTGDTLWFSGWKPYTESAYIGACIGLVFMALAFRALEALKIYYLVCVTEALTKVPMMIYISSSGSQFILE